MGAKVNEEFNSINVIASNLRAREISQHKLPQYPADLVSTVWEVDAGIVNTLPT